MDFCSSTLVMQGQSHGRTRPTPGTLFKSRTTFSHYGQSFTEEIKFLENAETITLSGNAEKKHKVSAL
jgi:hypothetical protein